MRKFIAAFDGLNFCESTLRYAIFLSQHSKAYLVGVFLEDFTRHSYGFQEVVVNGEDDRDRFVRERDAEDREQRRKSIEIFEQACQDGGVNYSIHRDRNVALQEVLEESIYADLLIVSAGESMTGLEEIMPTKFIRDLLNDVQCPVLLIPVEYKPINKIVLLYDGELSSVHAVRSFSYLFESLKDYETEVVTVKQSDETAHLPHNQLMKEFIKRHYPKAQYIILKGDAEDEIVRYLQKEEKQPTLVLGAYRRSKMSRLFRPSMADQLLEHLQMPLFIAHNKS